MIIVTAPTGLIGHQVLNNLLASSEPIRLIARDPSRLPAHTRERVEVVQGSHSDLDVVTRAFAGADSVFWLLPPDPRPEASKVPMLTSPSQRATRSRARGSSGSSESRPLAVGRRWPGTRGW
jgi:uncharacterized protein YbjT (DUF2867 family)